MDNVGQKYKVGDVTDFSGFTTITYGRFEFVGECKVLYCDQSYAMRDWYIGFIWSGQASETWG